MLVRFCLFFLTGSLSASYAQNTASVQLNVRLEPIQLLSVEKKPEKEVSPISNIHITSSYGYTVRLHRQRTASEKSRHQATHYQANLQFLTEATEEADVYKIISRSTGTQESLYAVYFEKHQKTSPEPLNEPEVPHYVYTIVSY